MNWINQNLWLVFAFISCLIWGAITPLTTIASRDSRGRSATFIASGLICIFYGFILWRADATGNSNTKYILFGSAAGVGSAIAWILLLSGVALAAKGSGQINVILSISRLHLAIGTLLNTFMLVALDKSMLNEQMSMNKWIGVALAVLSALFLVK